MGDGDSGSRVRREIVVDRIIRACEKRHSGRRGESLERVREIFEELGIEVKKGVINGSPFPIHGAMAAWTLEYHGEAGFWVARAKAGEGLPEERARDLFGRQKEAQPHGVYGAHGVLESQLSQRRTVDDYHLLTEEALRDFVEACSR